MTSGSGKEKTAGDEVPAGFIPQGRFDESTAIATGGFAAALALLNPILGVLAAGLAPFVSNRLNELYAARLGRAMEGLHSKEIDLEAVLSDGPDMALKADTLRDYIAASLETGSEEKIRFLLYLAEYGLKSAARVEILFAKRVIRTVARIDELEMIVLAALSRTNRTLKGVTLTKLTEAAQISDANVLRSGLAVLQSEGLVVQSSGGSDLFRVSDYGESVLSQLRDAMRDAAKKAPSGQVKTDPR